MSGKRFVGYPVPFESDGLRRIVVENFFYKRRATKKCTLILFIKLFFYIERINMCSHSLTVGSKERCGL